MERLDWDIPKGHRPVIYADSSKPVQYMICLEGEPSPPDGYRLLLPMTYVKSEPQRFEMQALIEVFDKVSELVREAHGKLAESGQPDLKVQLFIFHDTLEVGRDENHDWVASLGWGCLFGDLPDPPPWLEKTDWDELPTQLCS